MTDTGEKETINWSRMSLDELATFYWSEIAPAMRRDGLDPDAERASYEWLADHGYSGIAYGLREHHDLTVSEWFTDELGVGSPASTSEPQGYEWGIGDEQTIERFEGYLRSRNRRRDLSDNTIASKRSRLARYAREYQALHGEVALVERASDRETQPEEIERALAVFDVLNRELSSDDSKRAHLNDIRDWYVWLQNRAVAVYNPVATVGSEFGGWEASGETKPALRPEQIRALVDVTESRADRLLVLALGAWGLRRGEVAALHVSQFVPNADPPRVEFEERKNGPSDVQLLYGVGAYLDHVATLESDGWNGYLFPSDRSRTGHIDPGTVNNRFAGLVERADVRLRGEPPTPHACRRFWYNAYQDAMEDLRERLSSVTADQGSASTQVVIDEYLGAEQARRARREQMRKRLADAFEGVQDGQESPESAVMDH